MERRSRRLDARRNQDDPTMRPLSTLLALGLATPLATSCHLHFEGFTVDGVRLTEKHTETLGVETWDPTGLVIESHMGDVEVVHGEGPTVLVVEVHEREPGDAHAHVQDGRLVCRSRSGAPCGIGNVTVRTSRALPALTATTGMGDVTLDGVGVEGSLRLSSGMGDIEVRRLVKQGEVELDSGKGDIEVSGLECTRLSADTGMGDVALDDCKVATVALSTGMGDVEVRRSSGETIDADSGLGDVELIDSSFTRSDLDSGLGSVERR